jgi:hypothetical protein
VSPQLIVTLLTGDSNVIMNVVTGDWPADKHLKSLLGVNVHRLFRRLSLIRTHCASADRAVQMKNPANEIQKRKCQPVGLCFEVSI